MKILHILGIGQLPRKPEQQALGGTTKVVLEVSREQAAEGHEVVAAVVGHERWHVEWEGVRLVSLRSAAWARLRMGPWKLNLSTLLPLARLAVGERPDVIHAHEFNYLRYLPASIRVTHFHNDPCRFTAEEETGAWEISECLAAARYSHAHVVVSRFIGEQLCRRYQDLTSALPADFDPAARTHVVHNGVDVDRFSPEYWAAARRQIRATWTAEDDAVVFLFSGAVVPEKGLLPLAQAFATLAESNPRARLVLAGGAEMWEDARTDPAVKAEFAHYHQRLREELAPLEARGQVVHLGLVPPVEMPGTYAAADVVVIPSLVQEAFSLSALEALAAGKPLVASAVGGILEFATPDNSILVPPGDTDALHRALLSLTEDDDRRERLGRAARRSAQAFSWKRTARELDALYQDLMARRHTIVCATPPAFYRF